MPEANNGSKYVLRTIFESVVSAGANPITALIVGFIGPAVAQIPGNNGHFVQMGLYGVAVAVLIIIIVYLVRRAFRIPWIREHLGKTQFFEGVWLEVYSVNEAGRDAPTQLVPYRSVMVIKKNLDNGKFEIYGASFREKNINNYSQYSGYLLKEDEEKLSIDYAYSGQWYPEHSPAEGYARWEFHEDSNFHGKVTSAQGKWVELEHMNQTPWNSYGLTEIKKIESGSVKEKIGKRVPDRLLPKDFFALAYEA